MSDLFLKNIIKNNSNHNLTESSFNISKILNKNVNNNIKKTSTLYNINELSSTSYNNNSQMGGANNSNVLSATSLNKFNSNDINNLLTMLTSENNSDNATENLENKLIKLLNNQNGGNNVQTEMLNTEMIENKMKHIINNHNKQSGGSNMGKAVGVLGLGVVAATLLHKMNNTATETESNVIDKVITNPTPTPNPKPDVSATISSDGTITVTTQQQPTVFLPATKSTDNNMTTTDLLPNKIPDSDSATSSIIPQNITLSPNQSGGAGNVGLETYRDILDFLAKTMGVKNDIPLKKTASDLQKDAKKSDSELKGSALLSAVKDLVNKNKSKYEKIYNQHAKDYKDKHKK